MPEMYNYSFNKEDSIKLLEGLKRLPFGDVEVVIQKLIFQHNNQDKLNGENAPTPTVASVPPAVTTPDTNVENLHPVRKTRGKKVKHSA